MIFFDLGSHSIFILGVHLKELLVLAVGLKIVKGFELVVVEAVFLVSLSFGVSHFSFDLLSGSTCFDQMNIKNCFLTIKRKRQLV